MKIFTFILIVLCLLSVLYSFSSRAEEILDSKESGMIEFVKKDEIYDCNAKYNEILDELKQPQECSFDEDCAYFNYGYPWQPSACRKAIVSQIDEEKTISHLAKIEGYNQACIDTIAEEKAKHEALDKEIVETECEIIRLYCFKGYCRSKNYSVHTNDSPLR